VLQPENELSPMLVVLSGITTWPLVSGAIQQLLDANWTSADNV